MSTPADVRIPILAEEAEVTKRLVETGRVRVRTVVDTAEQLVSDTLEGETLEIERRPVDRAVAAAPPPREEDGATIISVVEERLVVTRQLHVVEEVVVRRVATSQPVSVPVTLRTMRAVVEHDPAAPQEGHAGPAEPASASGPVHRDTTADGPAEDRHAELGATR